jgi:hypothetical protein
VVSSVLQLQTLNTPELAASTSRVLYDDMVKYASGITIPAGVTNGTLTPTDRFETDRSVPANTRYLASKKVIEHRPAATAEQLRTIARQREELANKRPRLSE